MPNMQLRFRSTFPDHLIHRCPDYQMSRSPNPGSSPCLRDRFCFFRSPDHQMSRSPDLLQPSACVLQPPTPTPHKVLLKAKAKPQFDRAVTERSKSLFLVSQSSNRGQFQPDFSVFTVRSAEGCKPLQQACTNEVALASCQLLAASC